MGTPAFENLQKCLLLPGGLPALTRGQRAATLELIVKRSAQRNGRILGVLPLLDRIAL
jgi:hypothetical protein